jgi:hypothetical protein
MATLEEVKKTIEELPEDQQRKLIDWIEELKADLWDKQIEEDFMAGRLDKFIEEAMGEPDVAEFRDGRWQEL